jgi:hypothetical protein
MECLFRQAFVSFTLPGRSHGTAATFATSSGFGKVTGTQPNRQMQAFACFFF